MPWFDIEITHTITRKASIRVKAQDADAILEVLKARNWHELDGMQKPNAPSLEDQWEDDNEAILESCQELFTTIEGYQS